MTNRNDDYRRESQSYGRSGNQPRQEFAQQSRNESGRYESEEYSPSSQFSGDRYGSQQRYESAGQQGYAQPWNNERGGNYPQPGMGTAGERYNQFAQRNEPGGQGLHSQGQSGYRSQESMGYGSDYQPSRQQGYGYQEEFRGQGQGYGASSGYTPRENVYGHRYGSGISGYEGAGYPQQGQRDFGQRDFGGSSLRGQEGGFESRQFNDRHAQSTYGQGSIGIGQESGLYGSPYGGSQLYSGQRLSGVGQQSYRGRGPKNYTRSDERIIDDINERLTNDDDLDASDIEVRCENGVLTLEGTVEQRWMKHRAEDLAEACAGVRQIDNRIQVESSSNYSSSDLSPGLNASASRGTQASRKETGGKGASTSGTGSSQH